MVELRENHAAKYAELARKMDAAAATAADPEARAAYLRLAALWVRLAELVLKEDAYAELAVQPAPEAADCEARPEDQPAGSASL